jgi:hypothetical protein
MFLGFVPQPAVLQQMHAQWLAERALVSLLTQKK